MKLIVIFTALLVFSSFAENGFAEQHEELGSAKPCIEWSVQPNQHVDRRQAERLYAEACRWVKENIVTGKPLNSPCVKIIVGRPCPEKNSSGPCANPVAGEIYIPTWTPVSAGTVAQGTIAAMLLHLLDSKEITAIVQKLLNEDVSAFLDLLPRDR